MRGEAWGMAMGGIIVIGERRQFEGNGLSEWEEFFYGANVWMIVGKKNFLETDIS